MLVVDPLYVLELVEVVDPDDLGVPYNGRHLEGLLAAATDRTLEAWEVPHSGVLLTLDFLSELLDHEKATLLKGEVTEAIFGDSLNLDILASFLEDHVGDHLLQHWYLLGEQRPRLSDEREPSLG